MNHLIKPAIAAVVQRDNGGIDDLVAGFAISLINRGWRVRGLVQEMHQGRHGCAFSLVDLDDGKLYPITHDLGQHSTSCRLDTAGIAEASAVLRRIAEEGANLAVFNRFSGLEAHGEGFSAEMLEIMSREIPCLCVVPEKHLAAWRQFTGGLAIELEGNRAALESWFFATPVQPSATGVHMPFIGRTKTLHQTGEHA
ncbi:DUF2478 domain-containing protein [Dechloromonas denitrificans]|uniref:DUF2478 domain-containing protein n=1 Tax=Dechloromonas denitrificans TaxID=281362 RepID=UPI001CF91165|nr:DUF2478 domain-containing protein [Dechloromonas denitrificans]UCV05066.1 DUF2478 domain-containing protein [Dechloromonas denitrificans]